MARSPIAMHHCPACGQLADRQNRARRGGIEVATFLCPQDHIFSVQWAALAAARPGRKDAPC